MYWTFVSGISHPEDKYGFVDEREIRIATGIILVFALFSLFFVVFKGEFFLPLFFVSVIFLDFLLKIFLSPRWSLFGSFVRLFLTKGGEIWVGAVQKRFAWSIGMFLSASVLYCILILGGFIEPLAWWQTETVNAILDGMQKNLASGARIVTPMNPAIIACILCIIFMWSESIVGYCFGCHIYGWLVKRWWMRVYERQNCIGGICEIPPKNHTKTSASHSHTKEEK